MGAQLMDLYKKAQEAGGHKFRMRMAMLTGISSVKAESEPDSPENVEKLKSALAQIEKEN